MILKKKNPLFWLKKNKIQISKKKNVSLGASYLNAISFMQYFYDVLDRVIPRFHNYYREKYILSGLEQFSKLIHLR